MALYGNGKYCVLARRARWETHHTFVRNLRAPHGAITEITQHLTSFQYFLTPHCDPTVVAHC